jgi:hypothetical protein
MACYKHITQFNVLYFMIFTYSMSRLLYGGRVNVLSLTIQKIPSIEFSPDIKRLYNLIGIAPLAGSSPSSATPYISSLFKVIRIDGGCPFHRAI